MCNHPEGAIQNIYKYRNGEFTICTVHWCENCGAFRHSTRIETNVELDIITDSWHLPLEEKRKKTNV
jgi:hypothetical protein